MHIRDEIEKDNSEYFQKLMMAEFSYHMLHDRFLYFRLAVNKGSINVMNVLWERVGKLEKSELKKIGMLTADNGYPLQEATNKNNFAIVKKLQEYARTLEGPDEHVWIEMLQARNYKAFGNAVFNLNKEITEFLLQEIPENIKFEMLENALFRAAREVNSKAVKLVLSVAGEHLDRLVKAAESFHSVSPGILKIIKVEHENIIRLSKKDELLAASVSSVVLSPGLHAGAGLLSSSAISVELSSCPSTPFKKGSSGFVPPPSQRKEDFCVIL